MFGFIISILMIFVGIGGWLKFNKEFIELKAKNYNRTASVANNFKLGCAIIAIIGVTMVGFRSIEIVGPGEAATTEFLGKVSDEVLYSGVNIINPMCILRTFNIKTQETTQKLQMPAGDQLNITVDTTVQYRIDASQLPNLRREIGPKMENFMQVLFIPGMRGSYRDAAANFTSSELYIEKREEFTALVLSNMTEQLDRSFIIEDIIVRNVTPPQRIITAIEDKQQAQQAAEKMIFELQKAKLEAEKKVIEAKGIADSQDIIAMKLTPEYLAWYQIDMQKSLVNSPNNTIMIIPAGVIPPQIMLNQK